MNDSAGNELENALQQARDLDAPLTERLGAYVEECRRLAPECAIAWDRLSARLAGCQTGTNAPRPGELLPPFVLPDECGLHVALDELLKDGPLAIAFHTGHWCPLSRLNGVALAEAQERAEAIGGRIIAI